MQLYGGLRSRSLAVARRRADDEAIEIEVDDRGREQGQKLAEDETAAWSRRAWHLVRHDSAESFGWQRCPLRPIHWRWKTPLNQINVEQNGGDSAVGRRWDH